MANVNIRIFSPLDGIHYNLCVSPEDATRFRTDQRFASTLLNHAIACSRAKAASRIVVENTIPSPPLEEEIVHDSPPPVDEEIVNDYNYIEENTTEDVESDQEETPVSSCIGNDSQLLNQNNCKSNVSKDKYCSSSQSVVEKHNWEFNETKALIESYAVHRTDLNHPKKKEFVWDNITNDLVSLRYNVTRTQCLNKWKNLMRAYKKVIDNKNSTGAAASKFHFFNDIDNILGDKPSIACPLAVGSMSRAVSLMSDDSQTDVVIPDETIDEMPDVSVDKNISIDKNVSIDENVSVGKNIMLSKSMKRKPATILENEQRQKQHIDKLAIQQEKNELKIKLQAEKFKLKKSIEADRNSVKKIEQEANAKLKLELQEIVQEFKLRLHRDKMEGKEKLMKMKLEIEEKKLELESSKISVIERYLNSK